MDDLTTTLNRLDDHLSEAIAADPLEALTVISAVQRDVDDHQRKAVRAAVPRHSWTEIGEALGVSKQAAHQKFAKPWADELKSEIKAEARTFKTAMRKGELRLAADAKDKLDAVIDEFKDAGGRRRP
jgi:predicted component of type VI protein secretion system